MNTIFNILNHSLDVSYAYLKFSSANSSSVLAILSSSDIDFFVSFFGCFDVD